MLSNRPAESGAVAAALALLIARLLGVDDVDLILALGVVIGFVPAAITWLVESVRHDDAKPAVLEGGKRRR